MEGLLREVRETRLRQRLPSQDGICSALWHRHTLLPDIPLIKSLEAMECSIGRHMLEGATTGAKPPS